MNTMSLFMGCKFGRFKNSIADNVFMKSLYWWYIWVFWLLLFISSSLCWSLGFWLLLFISSSL